jgi:hypothetical protein
MLHQLIKILTISILALKMRSAISSMVYSVKDSVALVASSIASSAYTLGEAKVKSTIDGIFDKKLTIEDGFLNTILNHSEHFNGKNAVLDLSKKQNLIDLSEGDVNQISNYLSSLEKKEFERLTKIMSQIFQIDEQNIQDILKSKNLYGIINLIGQTIEKVPLLPENKRDGNSLYFSTNPGGIVKKHIVSFYIANILHETKLPLNELVKSPWPELTDNIAYHIAKTLVSEHIIAPKDEDSFLSVNLKGKNKCIQGIAEQVKSYTTKEQSELIEFDELRKVKTTQTPSLDQASTHSKLPIELSKNKGKEAATYEKNIKPTKESEHGHAKKNHPPPKKSLEKPSVKHTQKIGENDTPIQIG